MNRLYTELSPYLNSRAEDAVDWYPWGQEAFARAAAERKPMLISIGTTCAPQPVGAGADTVARLTERYFVPVQVDGQERPEVAAVYARAAALLTGERGLPIDVLADSFGNPFFAASALREVELAGLLSGVALHWNGDPAYYERIGALMGQRLRTGAPKGKAVPRDRLCQAQYTRLAARFDQEYGGFGEGAKSLCPHDLLFLMEYAHYTGAAEPMDLAVKTLRAMAVSGVRDPIGGGFFHGTLDRQWQCPKPEKRLIDQAWMLEAYTRAYRRTGEGLFRQVAAETADFVIRELRHAAGGFYAAQWSEDGFWLLTDAEVREALGETDGKIFCSAYAIGDTPAVPRPQSDEDTALLHDLRMKLYRHRLRRSAPMRDDKVLTGQNGVMIAALARAGRVLGVERYLTAACNCEEFLRSRLVTIMELRRYWCHGAVAGDGALEDYAGYALGLYELYRSGCGGEYLRHSAKVMARADALFSDLEQGGYYLSRGSGHLPARPKQLWDGSVPCGWSVALQVLGDLAREIRHPGLRARTRQLMEDAAAAAEASHGMCSHTLTAMLG